MTSPVVVTHHGRARVVLVSAEHFASLKDKDTAEVKSDNSVFETSFYALLDHIRDGFVALDQDLTITAVNGVAEAYLGLPRNQLVGFNFVERFPDLASTATLDRIRRVARSGLADTFEGRSAIFPDRYVHYNIFPYPAGVGLLFVNTTEAQLQKDRMQAAQAATVALNIASTTTYLRLNVRGVIVDHGMGFCTLTGLSDADLTKVRLTELVPISRRRALNDAMEDVLQHGLSRVLSSAVVSKDRGESPVEFSLAPIASDYAYEGVFILVGIVAPAGGGEPGNIRH